MAWLKDYATDEETDRDPSAVATLIEFARSTPQTTTATSLRREAMTGLGQSRDPRAIQFLQLIITK